MKKIILSICIAVIVGISTIFVSSSSVSVFNDENSPKLPVLMYHSVINNPSKSGKYVITPQKFEEDLLYLKQKGYETVSVKQIIQYVYNNAPLPKKPIILTFDDGMYNNYEYILPILEKHNSCAVFSIVGSYTDEYSENNIVDPAYSYLRWCDIEALSDSEHIEFGNHSYNFHSISAKRYGTQKNKYENSLDYINTFYQDTQKMQSEFYDHCRFRPIIYTYPFGSYSKESTRVLKKMGFMVTFSCTEGINKLTYEPDCLYLLKRYNRSGLLSTYQFFSKINL